MAKREQVVIAALKEQQPAQKAEKEMWSIAQACAVYEQLMMKFVVNVSKQGNCVNRRQC
ncbi:hypothetical protein [Paenibacillus thiaminolyticus]|uniref:hypothetical protein n=1 Tax=Paenibacillus thiaminolyticus TaxID=49283 RepID=UPI0015FFC92C|nr:hypothetical protein [Paenibacillus thiaminolyticus]